MVVCLWKCDINDNLFTWSQDEMVIPEVAALPKKETAWERGLKLAKEVRKRSLKQTDG